MPIITNRQHVLISRAGDSERHHADGDESMKEHLWVMGDDYEKPQKEMDFPLTKLGEILPPRQKSCHNLSINTYSSPELQDRYLSSEEEASPSPDDVYHPDEEFKLKCAAICTDDDASDFPAAEYKAEIAIAVPILAYGRPKLVDITNLAPMHKRKRSTPQATCPHPAAKKMAIRPSSMMNENSAHMSSGAVEATTAPSKAATQATAQPKRKESPIAIAPDSWFPEDNSLTMAEDEQHLFPAHDVRRSSNYTGYDIMSLNLPRPSRPPKSKARYLTGSHYGSSLSSSPSSTMTCRPSLVRPMCAIKKQQQLQAQHGKPLGKKAKMLARGSLEREEVPNVPPIPFSGGVAVA